MSAEPLQSPPAHPVPKAALYANHVEIWSSAVFLTLEEKGYRPEDLDRKEVNVLIGENYDPAYLKINPSGEVPTLVVPLEKFIGPEIESKYRPIHDVVKILEFLDKSRTALSTHGPLQGPAPTLAPATIDASSKSNAIIQLVHSETLEPEFLYLSAQTPEELALKAKGEQHKWLSSRYANLKRAFSPSSGSAEALPPALGVRAKAALELKEKVYDGYIKVYDAAAKGTTDSQTESFLKLSSKAWETDVKAALELIEKEIKISHVAAGEEPGPASGGGSSATKPNSGGTATTTHSSGANAAAPTADDAETKRGAFILGEHICLADLHLFPWLARLVSLSGGDSSAGAISKLEAKIGGGFVIGERVKEFWAGMLSRPSVQKVYAKGLH